MSLNMQAVELLGSLFVVILTFTLLCIFGPLTYYARQAPLNKAVPLIIFFTSIGLGFMLVEISQMQRLNIFLGHPVYGLSVVLVTMLLASGPDSGLTARVGCSELFTSGRRRLAALLLVLVVFGLLTPGALATFRGSATPWRILVGFVLLFPLGIFMGMAFPLGIKTADARDVSRATPWLWGINGAASVLASIVAVVLALSFGINLSFWCGVACYLAALPAFLAAWRHNRLRETARYSSVK